MIENDNTPSGVKDIQAMIFSAGLGTRFKPWTDQHPKALAIVNNKSLLQRNIEYLRQYDINNIIINVHHFAAQVLTTLKDNNNWGSHISISNETELLLETGGGLLKAKPLFNPGEKFITCNVDILTNLDLHKFISFHEEKKPLISLAVTNRHSSRYFLFNSENRLCGWRNTKNGQERISIDEKGLEEKAYSAVAIFEYDIFRLMEEKGFADKFSLVDVYLSLAKEHLILGYEHSGDKLVDVGKPESVDIAASLFP